MQRKLWKHSGKYIMQSFFSKLKANIFENYKNFRIKKIEEPDLSFIHISLYKQWSNLFTNSFTFLTCFFIRNSFYFIWFYYIRLENSCIYNVFIYRMVTCNYMVETASQITKNIKAAMIVSVPWDTTSSTASLEKPLNWFLYNRYLANALTELVKS